MAPAYLVHLAGEFEVVVPAEGFCIIEFIDMTAAVATAEIDKGIVVDVLVAELAETMTTGLVLHHTA